MPDQPIDLTAPRQAATPTAATQGPSPPLPEPPSVSFYDDGLLPHVAFGLTVSTLWDSGLSFAPVAGAASAKTVFWRSRAASSMKVITFVVARLGANPVAPHLDTGDPNDVLVSVSYGKPAKEYLPDGTPTIMLGGRYVYQQQTAAHPLSPILVPNSVMGFPDLVQLDPANFSRLLVPVESPPGTFAGGPINF